MEIVKMEENHSKHEELRSEWEKEEKQLEHCIEVIQHNIDANAAKLTEMRAETKELYDNYRSANPELHNDLVIGLSMQTQIERTLNKNLAALKKPFFGRIDYVEHTKGQKGYGCRCQAFVCCYNKSPP